MKTVRRPSINMFPLLVCLVLYNSQTISAFVVHDLYQGGKERQFSSAAVASNSRICSLTGVKILTMGGNAVDAAIATSICLGTAAFFNSGLGGDSVWTIYRGGQAYSIISRSAAPLASNATMYGNKSGQSVQGGLSVAVPGEVMGMWRAHQEFGKLPWSTLIKPTIDLAEKGFPCEPRMADFISKFADLKAFDKWPQLRKQVTNPETKTWYKIGEIMKMPLLAETMKKLADKGAKDFYNGLLADDIVQEIQAAGGIITKEDLQGYVAEISAPLSLHLQNNLTVYTPGLPSGGPTFLYILNILKGYDMTSSDLSNKKLNVQTFHRTIEAFKHAYAARSKMGSPYGETKTFVEEMTQLVANISSAKQGEAIRALISDQMTFPWTRYNPVFQFQEDHGTSNVVVLAPNGEAVAVTSTLNTFFGSNVVGTTTGILYNNMMDDFAVPGVVNAFGVQPSPANYIKPGKRPLSSMTPVVVVDGAGLPVLVAGAAGGTRITTTTAFLTAMTLWMGQRLQSVIDGPRIHHQLYPDEVIVSNAPKWLVEGLQQKGHKVVQEAGLLSAPSGLLRWASGNITAYSEEADVFGF